jgi:hypothetical protein
MCLYRPKVGITQIMATWLIMLPYAIGPLSHKTSCVLFINISSTTYVYELLLWSYMVYELLSLSYCYTFV